MSDTEKQQVVNVHLGFLGKAGEGVGCGFIFMGIGVMVALIWWAATGFPGLAR